jgi:hypothetical protein
VKKNDYCKNTGKGEFFNDCYRKTGMANDRLAKMIDKKADFYAL